MTPRLRLRGITRRYGELVANDGIDLDVAPGEIHAVLGENGAGKSTLMKIIYGVTQPDAGSLEWQGSPVTIGSPAAARVLGIGMVFQHFALFETLTVAENIALALDGRLAPAALAAQIHEVSHRYGLPVDAERLTHGMSVGERQRVEIVRCLLQEPKLLIMDEPTSVLTPQAVQALFETLRRLSAEGLSILYISHKLDEIRSLCTNATVLRGGRVTGTADPRVESNASLARMMVGGELRECTLNPHEPGEVRLQVDSLSLTTDDPFGTALLDIGIEVRSGEIVGIAGVSGNGQKELLAALSGERRAVPRAAIRIDGQGVADLGPAARRARGLRYVPEERLGAGTVPTQSLAENCLLTGESAGLLRGGVIRRRAARLFARETIRDYDVRCDGERSAARSLSGGNLQKFIVGREIRLKPRVLIVAQPTWGVDINAALGVRQSLIDLRNAGCAILVISEDLDELYAICDRLAVMSHGRLTEAQPTATLSVETVGLLMTAAPTHA